jgi:20S proteasome alpha/beta subunit
MIAPKPHSQPNSKRLPKRKILTIAIGIRTPHSIAIASDTQESTGGDLKGTKTKIAMFEHCGMGGPDGAGDLESAMKRVGPSLVCGAGDSGHVREFVDDLGHLSVVTPQMPIMPDYSDLKRPCFEGTVKEYLRRFHVEHVVPFAALPSRDRPEVEMIMATWRNGLHLYASEKTALLRENRFKAIGIGSTFAELQAERLYREDMTPAQAELLAAYIVYQTKGWVEGCGRYTHIHSIIAPSYAGNKVTHAALSTVSRDLIEEWEHSFSNTWSSAVHEILWAELRKDSQAQELEREYITWSESVSHKRPKPKRGTNRTS